MPEASLPSGFLPGWATMVVPPPTKCGWCISTHIADIRCICIEDCGVGYCPRTVEEGLSL